MPRKDTNGQKPATAAAPSKALRSRQLAMIHLGAAELKMRSPADDSTYRQMLWSVARVKSAADLDAQGREAVLRHLQACGWQQRPVAGREFSRYEKGSQAALIRHLWTQLHKAGAVKNGSDRGLRRFCATHTTVDAGVTEVAPQHLTKADANAIIEQLKNWLDRLKVGS